MRESRPVRWFGPLEGIFITDNCIIDLNIECIVTQTSSSFLDTTGLDGMIHRLAGSQFDEECGKLGGGALGQAKLTQGYDLNAQYIIHTVCPVYTRDDESLLQDCYYNPLNLAKTYNIHQLGFPVLAVEKCCFPKQKAIHIAIATIHKWLEENKNYKLQVVLSCVDYRLYAMACAEQCDEKMKEYFLHILQFTTFFLCWFWCGMVNYNRNKKYPTS